MTACVVNELKQLVRKLNIVRYIFNFGVAQQVLETLELVEDDQVGLESSKRERASEARMSPTKALRSRRSCWRIPLRLIVGEDATEILVATHERRLTGG